MRRFALLPALALALTACGSDEPAPARAATADVAGTPIEQETLPSWIVATGEARPTARAELATRVMARVTAVDAELGARVSAGQPLLRLGLEDIAAARQRAAAAVRLAEAAEAEARRHDARMDTLLAQDAVARVQRDQAALGLTKAEADLAMARSAQAEVEAQAAYAEIRAPFAGVVVARSVDPGDLAAPGMPLLVVERAGAREAVLHVPVDAAAGLAVGDTIPVESGARSAEAVITAVSGGADPMTRTVEMKAALPADWPTGTALTARVPTGTRSGLAVPESAIVRRGQLTGVQVVEDGRAVLRWVRLGRTFPDGRHEVLSGLEPGERIVR
ncbi:MAG: efflux RND transporter periplasmic adaptor subunit [Gemmatimonadota bacterium]|nr:efflux RND transporter periplasmic adaptor subunit [Gemmatimonadota bacterium]